MTTEADTPQDDIAPTLRRRAAKVEIPAEDPDERVTIILERSEKIPKVGLNVGHNGYNYLIKPGVPVKIPRKVLNVLKDAVTSDAVRDEDGNIVGFEDRSQYPFRYV